MQDNIALFASTTTFLETSSLLSKKNIPKMMTLTMDAFSLHIFFYFQGTVAPTVHLALEWSEKKYGLDNVFARVEKDNILLKWDYDKIKNILDQAFAKHSVPDNDKRYLRTKYKTIKRQHQGGVHPKFF